MMKLLTKFTAFKTILLIKYSATKYACSQWLYYGRSWKEAYEEYIVNLFTKMASFHDDEETYE